MEKIINKLIELGFTKIEATMYITLLKNGKLNGYQLAKKLDVSKSTIYQMLESMVIKGYIYLIPTESKEYLAKEPELLFVELEKRYLKTNKSVKNELRKLQNNSNDEYFIKVSERQNIDNTIIDIIKTSEKEIYLNSDFNLLPYKNELKKATKRGVRIIAFSFYKIDNLDLDMEIYYKSDLNNKKITESRLMIVSDLKKSFVVTKLENTIDGIYSENYNFTKIVSEHIHSDIYMAKLSNIFEEKFNEDLKIDTLHEKNNLIR